MGLEKEIKYGIWHTPGPKFPNFEGTWVKEESGKAALYDNERSAKRVLKQFVFPEQYEVRQWRS